MRLRLALVPRWQRPMLRHRMAMRAMAPRGRR